MRGAGETQGRIERNFQRTANRILPPTARYPIIWVDPFQANLRQIQKAAMSSASEEAWFFGTSIPVSTTGPTRSTTSSHDGRGPTSSTARASSSTTTLRERESPDAGLLAAELLAAKPKTAAGQKAGLSQGQLHHYGFIKLLESAVEQTTSSQSQGQHHQQCGLIAPRVSAAEQTTSSLLQGQLYPHGLVAPRVSFESSLRPPPPTPSPSPRNFLRSRTGRGGGAVPTYRVGRRKGLVAHRPLWGSRVRRTQPPAMALAPPVDGSDAEFYATRRVAEPPPLPQFLSPPHTRQNPLLLPLRRSVVPPPLPPPHSSPLSPRANTASLTLSRPVWLPAGIADHHTPLHTARPSIDLPSPFDLHKVAAVPQAPLAAQPRADAWSQIYDERRWREREKGCVAPPPPIWRK